MDYTDYTQPEVKTARYFFPVTGSGCALRLHRRPYVYLGKNVAATAPLWSTTATLFNQGSQVATVSFLGKGTDIDPESGEDASPVVETVVPGGTVTFVLNTPYYLLECTSVSGATSLRLDLSSRSRWDIVPIVRGDTTSDSSVWAGAPVQLVEFSVIENMAVSAYDMLSYRIPNDAFIYTGNGTLEYSLHNAPAWMSLSGLVISGSPTSLQAGKTLVTLKVTDGELTAFQKFNVTVTYVNQAPVLLQEDLSLTATVGVDWTSDVGVDSLFQDSPDDTLTYAFHKLPSWVTSLNTTLSGTPTSEDVGTVEAELTATDQGGLHATIPVYITVVAEEP